MKCQQLIGPANDPHCCSVPATYTIQMIDANYAEHLCVLHARKAAKNMDRKLWKLVRDVDGKSL